MEPQAPPVENLVELLDQLQDIVEPPPVSMAPSTWGWTALAGLLLALVALAAWAWLRHRRRTAYRRAALAELSALAPALSGGEAPALAALAELIRRTALVAFPRERIATLTGNGWIAFLDRTGGSFAPFGAALAAGPYAADPPAFDGPGLLRAARHWIARHHA
jgi:hypothetical protein